MITLEILSDPICPWCFIGWNRLERALLAAGSNPFVIAWRPFMLNPDMPPEGMARGRYLAAKFGGEKEAAEIYARIAQTAKDDGLDVNLDAIARTPSTLDAHRLIHWAGIEAVQTQVVTQLFNAYFRDGLDISDHDVLCDIAAEAGLERAVIARLLKGPQDVDSIKSANRAAQGMGVSGVPCFIIGKRYVLQGAQESATWSKLLGELGGTGDLPQDMRLDG